MIHKKEFIIRIIEEIKAELIDLEKIIDEVLTYNPERDKRAIGSCLQDFYNGV